jgi:hypothetical protein
MLMIYDDDIDSDDNYDDDDDDDGGSQTSSHSWNAETEAVRGAGLPWPRRKGANLRTGAYPSGQPKKSKNPSLSDS